MCAEAHHATPSVVDCSFGGGLRPGERSPGPVAASALPSRGREHAEPECTTRSSFQRDRDRVLHSSPFRRLTYKTQVFVFHEGDHYRTRLTHSLEVAQIARTIARQLRLDEDLAEVLALAHDLGHSPFGHAGERALQALMQDAGGFDHNAQSLRIVCELERKYRGFDGLNLSWETLEGLAKHNGPVTAEDGDHAIVRVVEALGLKNDLELHRYASAEAQVAALSDDIAYVNHDIDDALRAGLISLPDLLDAPLAGSFTREVLDEHVQSAGSGDEARTIYELTRRMITAMIGAVIAESRARLLELSPSSPEDIRAAPRHTIAFPANIESELAGLKRFMFAHVYRHPRVMRVMDDAEMIVRDVFARYREDPAQMHTQWREAAKPLSGRRLSRHVCDFVAGMTDRLAIAEHRRLFDATPDLR